MSIVKSSGPPSWSLDVSETGESTKCLWVGVMGLKAWGKGAEKCFSPAVPSTTPTHGHFVLSPVSLASRDQDGGSSDSVNDRHLRSNGKIEDCEQSTSLALSITLLWLLSLCLVHLPLESKTYLARGVILGNEILQQQAVNIFLNSDLNSLFMAPYMIGLTQEESSTDTV